MPTKSTRTIGIDSKAGRRSRTGSSVTMGISDQEAIECQQYFMAIQAGEEPTGKIRKIELVMYDEADMEEIEKNEALEKQIEELTEKLIIATTDIDISDSDQPMIEDAIIDQDEEDSKCKCRTGEAIDGKCVGCGLEREENEQLPANQPDLKIYDKKCECSSNAFKDGKCCNCGGLE